MWCSRWRVVGLTLQGIKVVGLLHVLPLGGHTCFHYLDSTVASTSFKHTELVLFSPPSRVTGPPSSSRGDVISACRIGGGSGGSSYLRRPDVCSSAGVSVVSGCQPAPVMRRRRVLSPLITLTVSSHLLLLILSIPFSHDNPGAGLNEYFSALCSPSGGCLG